MNKTIENYQKLIFFKYHEIGIPWHKTGRWAEILWDFSPRQEISHVCVEYFDNRIMMPMLIWVFAGCKGHFVGFVMRQLKWVNSGLLAPYRVNSAQNRSYPPVKLACLLPSFWPETPTRWYFSTMELMPENCCVLCIGTRLFPADLTLNIRCVLLANAHNRWRSTVIINMNMCLFKGQLQRYFSLWNLNGLCCKEKNAENYIKLY